MANAVNFFLAREKTHCRANAIYHGGVYDKERLRQIAALEAARDALGHLARHWDSISDGMQKTIMGTAK